MIVLLDSSAWLEYFFGSDKGLKMKPIIEQENDIIVSKINIFEVYYKILEKEGEEKAEMFVSYIIARSIVDELDTNTLKIAAAEKKKLKLGMADSIIFATALKYNATVYTTDADFDKMKGILDIIRM